MEMLQVARQAARAGGAVIARYFGSDVQASVKSGEAKTYNLVSQADVESERAIVSVIEAACPGHAILAEESHEADTSAPQLWVVDPLDGTNNFLHGIPHVAVSVAYYEAGRPVCGVVLNPLSGECYEAIRGGGASCNGRPLRVCSSTRLDQILVAVGFYYDRGRIMEATLGAIADLFRQQIHGIRRMGTASLDLAWVAAGRFGAFFELELSAWDFAAGRLLVEEAGGRVTSCRGEALPLAKSSILATNNLVHSAMLDVLHAHVAAI